MLKVLVIILHCILVPRLRLFSMLCTIRRQGSHVIKVLGIFLQFTQTEVFLSSTQGDVIVLITFILAIKYVKD